MNSPIQTRRVRWSFTALVVIFSLLSAPFSAGPVPVEAVPLVGPQLQPLRLVPAGGETCGGVFLASADTYVDQSSPDSNYGDDSPLHVKWGAADEQRAYFDFDLSSVPVSATIHNAYLQLALTAVTGTPPIPLEVRLPVDNWGEGLLTWNNQLPLGSVQASLSATTPAGGVLNLDLTTLVSRWVHGEENLLGFALLAAGPGSVTIESRETAIPADNAPRLVIECALPNPAVPADPGAGDAAQQSDLDRLRQNSSIPVSIEFENGAVRFADFRLPIPDQYRNDPLAAAWWFLEDYRGLIRLSNPGQDLQLSDRATDNFHLVFRRRHLGIPVYPAELVVHMDQLNVTGLSGRYITDITLNAIPRLGAERAEALALASSTISSTVAGDTLLRYVNLGLLGQSDTTTHLAWQVNVADPLRGGLWVFIDAHDGRRLQVQYHTYDTFDLDLETALNGGPDLIACYFFLNNDQWFNQNGPAAGFPDPVPPSPDAEGTNAFNFIRNTDQLYRNNLGRDSMNDRGMRVTMYVHVGVGFQNAQYSSWCDQLEFGDNMATQDIVAHEYTHGVVEETGGLIYQNQSGALNESYADIFGYFTDTGDWTIGEGSALGPIRNLQTPNAFGDPDHMLAGTSTDGAGLRVLPAGTSPDCGPSGNDCGFVHTNSGINNKAAYLLIQGDTFNGFTINALGITKARRLFYNILNNRRLTSSAQFIDQRNAALLEAGSLASTGAFGFTLNNVCQVRNAYAAVGLGVGDVDCDGLPDTTDADNDNDGVLNGADNCPVNSNTGQQNLDGDGLGDACDPDDDNDGDLDGPDNCDRVPNANQADRNSNGIGDVCDDPDGDGVMDSTDNCRDMANADQRNRDSDSLGDVCDPDRDGDGLPNATDNSPDNYNPGQQDADSDGIGDASDRCPALAHADNTDTDNDGLGNPCDNDDDGDLIPDGADNCPLVRNTSQIDTDGDGVGLACDADEFEDYGRVRHLFIDSVTWIERFPYVVPIPLCPYCPPDDYLPADLLEQLTIDMPVDFGVRIVDSNGLAQARGPDTDTFQILRFQPAPYGEPFNLPFVGGTAAIQGGDPLVTPAADGVRYYLELYPGEGTDPHGTYPLTLTVTSVFSRTIQLPIVMQP